MTEPFVCDPIATGTSPDATAAAEPADDPPGEYSCECGFFVRAGLKMQIQWSLFFLGLSLPRLLVRRPKPRFDPRPDPSKVTRSHEASLLLR